MLRAPNHQYQRRERQEDDCDDQYRAAATAGRGWRARGESGEIVVVVGHKLIRERRNPGAKRVLYGLPAEATTSTR